MSTPAPEQTEKSTPDTAQPTSEAAPVIPDRPEWLLPKYKTVEEQAKAYVHAEKLLGLPKEQRQAAAEKILAGDKPADTPAKADGLAIEAKPQTEQQQNPADLLKSKGLDYVELQKEHDANGGLKPETYAKLEQAGIPKNLVDAHIKSTLDSNQLAADQFRGASLKAAGIDEAKFVAVREWAGANIAPEMLAVANKALTSGDPATAGLALKGLYAEYVKANGNGVRLLHGGNGAPSADVYESAAQLVKDQMSQQYHTDPAFRQKVYDKLRRSSKLMG